MLLALLLSLVTTEGDGISPPVAPMPMAPMPVAPTGPAAPVSAPAPVRAAPVMAGGYASLSPRAPQLQPVLAAALPSLTPAHNARARIVRAEQQVVAGMNYRLLVKLRDGSRWRVVVWQRLDGGYEVTEAVRQA